MPLPRGNGHGDAAGQDIAGGDGVRCLRLVAVLPGEGDRDHLADLHGRADRHVDLDAVADLGSIDPGIGCLRHADRRRRQVRRIDRRRAAEVAGSVSGDPG
ncbi:hypothetical protein PPS11_23704 [Pseudomonas putida S11]|nr:hypothetical protein PPS11_23704 [Pseudomonas putida S11]